MESDGFSTPPLPPEYIHHLDAENAMPDDDSGMSEVLRSNQDEVHRAHLARSVPHLYAGNGGSSSASPSSPASPISPSPLQNNSSRNASHTPADSSRPSPAPSDEGTGEGADRDMSMGPGHQSTMISTRHPVVKGFRGPLPRSHDAESIAPIPSLIPVAGSSLYNTVNHPYTRNGYIYTSGGPASEYLPTSIYKTIPTEPRGIHWSWSDRSPFTHISRDASTVCADRGFRSARANVPIREGAWYVEMHIIEPEQMGSVNSSMQDGPHVRLGWARREAGLNAPVGINGYSYGFRDTGGEKIFLSRTYKYGKAFGPGDVIGMYINLPKGRQVNDKDPLDPARVARKRIPIRYKGQIYFETLEYPVSKEMEHLMARSRRGEKLREDHITREDQINGSTDLLFQPQKDETINIASKKKRKSGPGPAAATSKPDNTLRPMPTLGASSQIGFFINGEPQGIAFENLLDFRPLRRQKAKQGKQSSLKAASSSLGLGEEGANDASIITTSSSLASIMKSRENIFDDGFLGYFPFVSLFGGARVKMVTRAEDFRYPPPDNVRQALEEADRLKGKIRLEKSDEMEVKCRPLEERYEEYLQELWTYDLEDEIKAKKAYEIFLANQEEEDEEEEEDVKPAVKTANKKQKKKLSHGNLRSASPRVSETPNREEKGATPSNLGTAMTTNDVDHDHLDEADTPAASETKIKREIVDDDTLMQADMVAEAVDAAMELDED